PRRRRSSGCSSRSRIWNFGARRVRVRTRRRACCRSPCLRPPRAHAKRQTPDSKPSRRHRDVAAMIRSFVFNEGKLVGQDLEREALRLVRADKGLILWVDLDQPTEEEWKFVLESVFEFHPLAVEDCVAPNSLPKVEDYDEYLFIVTHAVDFSRQDKFATTEL